MQLYHWWEIWENKQKMVFKWKWFRNKTWNLVSIKTYRAAEAPDMALVNSMQTCNSVTFYFMKKTTNFLILAGSVFCQLWLGRVNMSPLFVKHQKKKKYLNVRFVLFIWSVWTLKINPNKTKPIWWNCVTKELWFDVEIVW